MSNFYYTNEIFKDESNNGLISINVPRHINDKRIIFELYSSKLNFPEYFGWNWDAFFECMITLPHTVANKIIIMHNDVPFQMNTEQQNIYIFLLNQIVEEWKGNHNKELIVCFPKEYQVAVSTIEAQNEL